MIKNIQEIIRQKVDKGLNTYKNFFNLSEGQTPASINVVYNNDGSFGKRLGASTMNTTVLEGTAGYGMYDFGVLGVGGNDSNTNLLLHGDGMPVTDSSRRTYTITTYGNIATSSIQSKFGGASLLFATTPEIDFMEYTSDADAQANYVTSDSGAIDANTKLLLHCDGTDGSTTFTDSSSGAKTMTAVGNAQIDTAQSKFGGASGLFDGTGDYLTTPDHADWNFGSGDFTIDLWVRIDSLASQRSVVCNWRDSNGNRSFKFNVDVNGNAFLRYSTDGTNETTVISGTGLLINTWYHLALERYGNTGYFYKNGVKDATTIDFTGITIFDGTQVLSIGVNFDNLGVVTQEYSGWMDEIRISNIARYQGTNFTSPTSAYGSPNLQSYSEATIKQQGSYSLKGIANATTTLTDTLIRTLTSSAVMDLREQDTVSFYLYSSRTGANIRIGLQESAATLATMQTTPYIVTTNSWHAINWDISSFVADSKDGINRIIFTIMEDSAANTFYIDSITSGAYKIINKSMFLTAPYNVDWTTPGGLGNFTIDNWLNFNYVTTSQVLIGQGSNATNYWHLVYNTAATNTVNGLYFQAYSGGTLVINLSGLYTPNTGSFTHYELVRNATNNWYLFVAGSNIFNTGTTAGLIPGSGSLLKLGVNVVTTNNAYLCAFADEWRYSNNARHVANFTSPTVAYNSDIVQERRLLCASGTGIYYSTDIGKNWAIIQTNRTANINYFGFIKDYVINTNESYDPPQYWAGTAAQYFANISTATPACKHSASHQGFALLLNESANKTGFYYIDQNNMFSSAWSNFKLPTGRNDELTAGFTIGRSLYISSKYKIFRLNYIGGNPDWEYVEVRDWGFVPKTVKKVNLPSIGEAAIGLDWTKKIRIFFGADDEILSDHIAKDNGITPFYLNNISSVDLNKCWAEDDKKAQVYRLFLAYGGSSTISYEICFNYRSGSWYPENERPYQSGILAADSADNLYMLGCNYNGRINVMDSGNTEAGIAINEYHISPLHYLQSPSRVHKSQQIDMFFATSSSGTIYLEDRSQFSNVWNLRKEITLTSVISAIQIRHTIDIPESMNVHQFKLSSSANTAEPWQCNLIDLGLSDVGIGKE